MNKEAICIWCGTWKKRPWSECPSCKRTPAPNTKEELKSVYLSTRRFDDGEDILIYKEKLKELSIDLLQGIPVKYDEQELINLDKERQLIGKVKNSNIIIYLLKIFSPVLGFLLFLWLILQLIRYAKE